MTSLRGFFDIDLAMGLNFRGAYNAANTYEGGDVVVHSGTAYVAGGSIAAGVTPPTGLWGLLANQGIDGTDGDYTVWLFARGTSPPRRPNTLDASLASGRIAISSTVWLTTEPAGNGNLYVSWVRYSYNSSSWQYGQVTDLSGEPGTPGDIGPEGPAGDSVSINFSPNGTSSWTATPVLPPNANATRYIRFRIGTGAWTAAVQFVGSDGTDGTDGTPGTGVLIQFAQTNSSRPSDWHNIPRDNDKYIRFSTDGGTVWSTGIKFVGDDGTDGDDSLEAQYSATDTGDASYHETFQSNDVFIRFRIGNLGAWGTGIRFVGRDGAAAPHMQVEYSNASGGRFDGTFRTGDKYIRFSTDGGTTWLPSAAGVKFIGDDGTEGGVGNPGESVSMEFSADGMGGWHTGNPTAADYFVRFQVGSRGWQTGIQFRAYALQIQYSADNMAWHTAFVAGTDKYIRFSNDNGANWTTGDRFVGEDGSDGTDGDDTLEVQYSVDNNAWHAALNIADRFIRFRVGGTGPWSTGIRFVGTTGGFQATLYQRSANQPAAPSGVTYNPASIGNPYGNAGSWTPTVPSGTEQLWRISVTVPPATTTGNLSVTVNGIVYSERGATGDAGADGKWFRPVYQWSASEPADPTGLSYNINNGTIDGLSGGWHEAVGTTSAPSHFLWASLIEVEGTRASQVQKWRASGPKGADSTTAGPAGTDGNSVDVIYQRNSSTPATPSGGTWNGSDYDPPNGWHESVPSGTDPIYMVVVNLSGTNQTNTGISYDTVINITSGGGSGTGADGDDGSSIDIVYRRSATALTVPPTGGVAQNGEIRTAPTGWSTTIPSGTDPIYTAVAHIDGATNSIRYDEPIRWQGTDGSDGTNAPQVMFQYSVDGNTPWGAYATNSAFTRVSVDGGTVWGAAMRFRGADGTDGTDGTDGAKGDSIRAVWRTAATRPSTPVGLVLSSAGAWTDLIADDSNAWRADPVEPSGNLNLWQQDFQVDWATNPPGLTALGQPFQVFVRGIQGQAGESIRFFYMRTTTSATPTTPGITFNGSAFGGLGDWVPSNIPGAGGDFIWRVAVAYRVGVNGQQVTNPIQYSAQRGAAGTPGAASDDYVPIFMRSTTIPAAAPAVGTWDGTTYTPSTGWSTTAPAATMTEYVVMQWTRLTRSAPYTVTNVGVPQLSSLILPVAPVSPTTTAVRMTYGIADDSNNPVGTAQRTAEVQMAVGDSHTFAVITMPLTTATGDNYYVELPAGFVLTGARDSFQGETINDWTRHTQRWVYAIGFARAQEDITFTIRRDS